MLFFVSMAACSIKSPSGAQTLAHLSGDCVTRAESGPLGRFVLLFPDAARAAPFKGLSVVLNFLLSKTQASPARKKPECEKTPERFAESRFVPDVIRGLMGLFLSLPWNPELNLVSYNSEELDLEPGKEGIRYMYRRLGHLI